MMTEKLGLNSDGKIIVFFLEMKIFSKCKFTIIENI